MLLSDRDIAQALRRGELRIEGYDERNIQPASVDLTLDREFLVPSEDIHELDLAAIPPDHMKPMSVGGGSSLLLEPGDFVLASTREYIELGPGFAARVEGKSSLGRVGLTVHVTAGFIDPGFSGHVTLEIANLAPWAILLYPGMKICQIAFTKMSSAPEKLYGDSRVGSHYQGQRGPTQSRYDIGSTEGLHLALGELDEPTG